MNFTINDEPVKLLLSGIFKSGKTMFFRIDADGKHQKVNVSLALRSLKSRCHLPADSSLSVAQVAVLQ